LKQDANKVIDNLNNAWANDMVVSKKRIAILSEENERLKAENNSLKAQIKNLKETEDENDEVRNSSD